MLIDAGETINNAVINKIDELGITKLDTVVATHPHNDHISEMPSVLKKYEIGNFYLPKVSHTSNVFETMIDIVSEKSINVKEAKAGETITVPEGFKCDIIAPCGNNYSSLNDWSAVIRLVYGNTSFLFTGDAEELSEREILEKGYNVSADILKLGHHGSSTSTCNDFLDAVNPKYAIVSAGKDNSYGHPHKETISKLNEKNIQTFITYDCGTVTATSDGNNIYIKTESGEATESVGKNEISNNTLNDTNNTSDINKNNKAEEKTNYIGNVKSKKLHRENCISLPEEKNRIVFDTKEKAYEQGYSNCLNCNP